MLVGLGVTVYYLLIHNTALRGLLPPSTLVPGLWWGIEPISAGVFGAPLAFVATWAVSLLTRSRVNR